jgi:transposase
MPHRQELFHRKTLRGSRDMLRYRRRVMESRAADRNRLLNLLETANIKSASVALPP